MRNITIAVGEYYHIFNRGVDKRPIFNDRDDFERFLQSMCEFNVTEPIGSIFEHALLDKKVGNLVSKDPLVEFVAYCLNTNHYHFILGQLAEKGIEKFMHKIGLGYTKYFNLKHKRSGALFQGTYKAVHIESNGQLLYASACVNLNNEVHGIKKLPFRSSWQEYTSGSEYGFCNRELILDQFKNIRKYKEFARMAANEMRKKRDMEDLVLE